MIYLKKSLEQNFLIDKNIVKKIINTVENINPITQVIKEKKILKKATKEKSKEISKEKSKEKIKKIKTKKKIRTLWVRRKKKN